MSGNNTRVTSIWKYIKTSELRSVDVDVTTYITVKALPGDIDVEITGPSGVVQGFAYDACLVTASHKIRFTPTEPGLHRIYVTVDGLAVQGSPLTFTV